MAGFYLIETDVDEVMILGGNSPLDAAGAALACLEQCWAEAEVTAITRLSAADHRAFVALVGRTTRRCRCPARAGGAKKGGGR